ncbi:hypothetical protein E5S70_07380 [Ensifer adhaerens]|uniref:hypothetical protein n=1 Tax=Ensifer canadensis TaxID=555315 RepID=UPI00148FA5BF|nr:hypothetical protein [Ensifer canadensis]NOV15907.1 hypothetical protein [Ensifer canadensis]
MTERRDHEALPKALQPFSRVLAIHDALPDGFKPSDATPLREILPGIWPTTADLRALVEWGAKNPSPAPSMPCPCTTFEHTEECPVGYPSLLCSACDGTGNASVDKVVALAAELMKIAEQVDELEDPFAAWESVDLIKSQRDRLLEEARDVIASASDTYKKRNGHLGSFEDDSGEKCWIVPFDAFEGLRSAVDALASTEGSEDA